MTSAEGLTNGTITPPSTEDNTTSASAPKRKRADTADAPLPNGVIEDSAHTSTTPANGASFEELLKDVLAVLRK